MTEPTPIHPDIDAVTRAIEARSRETREAYVALVRGWRRDGPARAGLSAGNLAHAAAACALVEKRQLLGGDWPNLAIVTAYNDMLSAHQPFERFPALIRQAAREVGATAQVAGGVPAMCDGVTQGQAGMELSLFSRDVIAMSAAVALSHDVFDAGLFLGVCDKIVPGLVIAALRFGWLPAVFVPAGPMPSGLPNPEKAKVRQRYAEGQIGREALLEAEAGSYHAPGTCTFYGTANSNQMLMELMGFHLPGTSFVPPNTPLRHALTAAAVERAASLSGRRAGHADERLPAGEMIDARSIVNAIVGLMATGGSTNHALHLPAIAAAAGYRVTLEDFDVVSRVTPLLCRIYPNGPADVNHFHAAGGLGFVVRELLGAGLLQGGARGIAGPIADYAREPFLRDGGGLEWRPAPERSGERDVLRPANDPFQSDGGLRLVEGPLGRGVAKVSAVKPEHRRVDAPARVFESQHELKRAFEAGELERDFVAVVRFQGPRANGMPELHSLSPPLGALQDRGFRVALVTDGRMSGASGKVPSAIHLCPEAAAGGPLARVRDGDRLRLDTEAGRLEIDVEPETFAARAPARHDPSGSQQGLGRELFALFRQHALDAEHGGGVFDLLSDGGKAS
ncbi:MAG: phosphogluconate dehydratase [Myxococcota bacterium]